MHQRSILMVYLFIVGMASSVLGGFIACGAQSYRVSIHDNDPDYISKQQTGNAEKCESNCDLNLIHSKKGWKIPISFYVSEEISDDVSLQLQKAMTTWEAAVGKKLFNYKGKDTKKGSDFNSLLLPLNDNINSHYFDYSWAKNTGKSSRVLATTIWESDNNDTEILVKADIRFNAQNYVLDDSIKKFSSGEKIIVDLESLALHELGHFLGLNHVTEDIDKDSVMNPSLFIGEGMFTRSPSDGDIDRIRSIYGIGDESQADKVRLSSQATK